MRSLLIRDFINYKTVFVTVALLVPIGFILSIPPFAISLGLLLPILFVGVVFSEYRTSVNRFLISLPIERSKLVISRYLSMLIVWIGIVFYQLLLGYLFDYFVPYPVFVYSWKDCLALFCLGLITLAIYVPFYYLFRSFALPTIVIFICYFTIYLLSLDALVNISGMEEEIIFNYLDTWTVPLIESVITFYPFFVLPFLAIGLFYTSMKVSEKLMIGKKTI